MQTEAQAILAASERLGDNVAKAVELILARRGKLIVSGIGKSGHVGRKLAATFPEHRHPRPVPPRLGSSPWRPGHVPARRHGPSYFQKWQHQGTA